MKTKTSRLRLDFSLNTSAERSDFINSYVAREEFIKYPLTPDELEMCGNYVLWGKSPETGKNAVQDKIVQIDTKSGDWDTSSTSDIDSLDMLMEQPTFNENSIRHDQVQYRIPRETFSRVKALEEAPAYLRPTLEELFARIDRLDLVLNYYDLNHGKRKNPPREALLERFSEEEQIELAEESTHINQYQYLRMRHDLVELRRNQFAYKDMYKPIIQKRTLPVVDLLDRRQSIGVEIPVFPFGTIAHITQGKSADLDRLIFQPLERYYPQNIGDDLLRQLSDFIWAKKAEKEKLRRDSNNNSSSDSNRGSSNGNYSTLMSDLDARPTTQNGHYYIDFTDEEHLYNMLTLFYDFEDDGYAQDIEGTSLDLLNTIKFYIDIAKLTPPQREILELKQKRYKNQDIADYINVKYSKSYSANYISTIFRQKIIKLIKEAVEYHQEIVENLFFPENFKCCNYCGRLLLINTYNFIRKTRSKDGFASRCKQCDRLVRQKKKEVK